MKIFMSISVVLCMVFLFGTCADGSAPAAPGESMAAAETAAIPAETPPPATPPATHMQKISDMSEAWSDLYNQNEAVVNAYEGMPIMGLVTAPTTFIATVQFDIMNPDNRDGRFEGKMMLAGYQGFVEKSGDMITFGWDDKLAKDGFGPGAKAGDRMVGNGRLELAKEYYVSETFTERAGKKIARTYHEFKRLSDGSMICLAQTGQAFNMRGDAENRDEIIFIHNGPGRLDFVIAKAASGPAFQSISFAEKGDLTKAQALDLFKAAGYTIDKSGGIQDGSLIVDK
jgi:hypothetical protein